MNSNKIKIENHNPFNLSIRSNLRDYILSPVGEDGTPTMEYLTLEEIIWIDSNTNAIRTGLITINEDDREEVFKEIKFEDGDKIITNKDVENILLKLIQAADGDIEKAEKGIIYIDEIDKITRKSENPSITRDVSGEGVQQALLKIVEGTIASVPPQGGRKHPQQEMIQIDTSNILFICGGAFEGLENIIKDRIGKKSIGFGAEIQSSKDMDKYEVFEQILPQDLLKFGMIPEFIGRLPIIATLKELDRKALIKITTEPKNALVKQYKKLLEIDGVELEFEPDALEAIVDKAIERKTGARGLRSIIENVMTDIMYDIPSNEKIEKCIITKDTIQNNAKPKIIENPNKESKKKQRVQAEVKETA